MIGNQTYHYCTKCNNDYKYELNLSYYKNCYNICENYYFFDINTKKFYCTNSSKCPKLYNKFIPSKKQCINNCSISNEFIYEYNNICYDKCPKNTISDDFFQCYKIINYTSGNKTMIIENIRKKLKNGLDMKEIDKGNDLEIEEDNLLITITNTFNQKKNMNINKTSINLGECENKLKNVYNISTNNTLYILKIEKKIEGMNIPKIEYEVYYPLLNKNLFQLNLTNCENTNIEISIPIKINDTLDKYNTDSNYYTDICSTTTSDCGTDISLKDRKNNFVENNMTLCEEKCSIKDYDYNSNKVKCSCEIKIKIPMFDEIKFDKNELYKRFTDINNIGNLKLIKCFKNVLTKEYIIKNYGFFIFAFIDSLFFICLFAFYLKFYSSVQNKIKEIVLAKKEKLNKKKNQDENAFLATKTIKFNEIEHKKKNKQIKSNNKKISHKNKKKIKKKGIKNLNKKDLSSLNSKNKLNSENNNKEILKYNDIELNELTYKKALNLIKDRFLNIILHY